jgi:hypothetical protein
VQSSAPQKARDVACSYSLSEVGSLVWRQLDGQRSVEDVAADVARRFEIPPEQALADVREFVDEIVREGLLVLSPMEET